MSEWVHGQEILLSQGCFFFNQTILSQGYPIENCSPTPPSQHSTARIIAKVPVKFQSDGTQRVHDAIIKSLWHQNDVTTSFWLHNDVIIASRARWVQYSRSFGTLQVRSYNKTSYWTLTLGHVSISNKTSYYKISQSFEAPKFVNNDCLILYWNLAGTSAAVLLMCLSNFEVICTF